MNARCDTVSGELHATFMDNSPGGSHALPLIAPPVAQPLAQPVAPPVAQPEACQRPDTVNTVAANNLPKPHRDRSRDHAQTHNLTTTSNTNFPASTSRKVTLSATRSVHPHSWSQPTKTPTFPHRKAKKSLQNQHVLSILQVGCHQLQYRFFRTNKPKSRHKTNTFCPLTLTPPVAAAEQEDKTKSPKRMLRGLLVAPTGVDPVTFRFSVERSTN